MRGFFMALVVSVWAAAAVAGPWPRDKGLHFLALGTTGNTASLWAERGLGGGRWLALDGWLDRGSGAWLVAATYHRALRDRGAWKLAWSAGVAVGMPATDLTIDIPVVWFPGSWQAVIKYRPTVAARLGLSLGRSLERPWPGWTSLDLRLDAGPTSARIKAEATLGYRLQDRWAVIGQLQMEKARGARAQVHLAPSVVWTARGKVSLELGLRHGLHDRRTQVKLGSWLEF